MKSYEFFPQTISFHNPFFIPKAIATDHIDMHLKH